MFVAFVAPVVDPALVPPEVRGRADGAHAEEGRHGRQVAVHVDVAVPPRDLPPPTGRAQRGAVLAPPELEGEHLIGFFLWVGYWVEGESIIIIVIIIKIIIFAPP